MGLALPLVIATFALASAADSPALAPKPPRGFTALFNGKDLTGWRGGETFNHRDCWRCRPSSARRKIAAWTVHDGNTIPVNRTGMSRMASW